MIKNIKTTLFSSYLFIFAPSETNIPLNLVTENTSSPEFPSMGILLLKTFLSLVIIIILSYFIVRFLRSKYLRWESEKEWIQLLDYQPLGQNRGVYLAKLVGKYCLLSVTDGQIQILKEYTEIEIADLIDGLEKNDDRGSFNNILSNIIKDKKDQPSFSGFNKQLEDQIKKTKDLYRN